MKYSLSHLTRSLIAGLVLLFMAGCMSSGNHYDCGFIASRDRDLNGSERFRALGPFFEFQETDQDFTFDAIRPFYSRTEFPEYEKKLTEVLWPVGMFKDFHQERFWRVFPAWGRDFETEKDDSRFRFHIFPIFFSGRDTHGKKYFAVFPIGGKIHEFLGRDELTFALFPLYAHSSVRKVETWDYLWPIVSVTKGEEMNRFRVFPFFGTTESEGRYRKRFVMWPFYTDAVYNYSNEKGAGFILFPLYGHAKAGDKESWMFLPPFFRYSVSPDQKSANMPYPFIQYAKGNVDKLYVWPLWGWKEDGAVKSSFFIWPIIRRMSYQREDTRLYRFNFFPLVTNDSKVNNADGTVSDKYFKLWPLMSYKRHNDSSRFKLVDLWPTREIGSVERNFAPIWTLFSRDKVGDATDTELLWGLYRRRVEKNGDKKRSIFPLYSSSLDAGEENRKWNVLGGLIGYEREGLRKRRKLLYFIKF